MSNSKVQAGLPLLALLFLAIAGPAWCKETPATSSARPEQNHLSQEVAAQRSARVSNVAYDLDFTLTGEPVFKATSRIDFDLADADAPLTIDLDKARISSLQVNGKPITPQYNQWFITLPAAALVKGRNTVSVSFEREHSTNGEGLHRFQDKTDGRIYLYSHFEPAAAHQMFAVFDQPDLKATFRLSVTAPKDWQVISSTRETAIKNAGTMRRWSFPTTPALSPYNFSMHAGPYKMWEDNSGKYPMRLFARQSVAAQIWPKDWFRYTGRGLAYFDKYFGIAYPFKKYDQVLVPQFIYGAMENAAAVTFSEGSFLSASEMTADQRESLASVILHEMAHQWFGDLVTMRWWNGLWLNESFASYMATLGSAGSTEFSNTWLSFYRSKQSAYRADESITTHPIEVPVPTTDNAFDNIDSITYNKGASTLHQLRMLIGDEPFRRGVHDYLVRYSYRNATLDDFIGALSNASGRDLAPWAKQWLYEPGLNTLGAEFSCSNGKISRFQLQQSPANANYPTLREQLVQVGLFNVSGDSLALTEKQSVTYVGANTDVPALVGKRCPDLVYPNYEDWGFAKVVLDPASFATARTHLARVSDPMLRSMLWQSLSDSLRDRRIGLEEFVEAVLVNTPVETDYDLLGQALGYVGSAKSYITLFAPDSEYDRQVTARMEAMLWDGLLASRGNRDRASRWLWAYIGVASSKEGLARVRDILEGRVDTAGVAIDQDVRWALIDHLNTLGVAGSEALVTRELERDKSESGQLSALSALVSRPDPATKTEWLAKIQKLDGAEPYSRLRVAMGSLYPSGQGALSETTAEQRLQTLASIDKAADPVFMRSYANSMIPTACTAASVSRLEQVMKSMDGLSAGTRRALLSEHEADVRCVAIRNKFKPAALAQ